LVSRDQRQRGVHARCIRCALTFAPSPCSERCRPVADGCACESAEGARDAGRVCLHNTEAGANAQWATAAPPPLRPAVSDSFVWLRSWMRLAGCCQGPIDETSRKHACLLRLRQARHLGHRGKREMPRETDRPRPVRSSLRSSHLLAVFLDHSSPSTLMLRPPIARYRRETNGQKQEMWREKRSKAVAGRGRESSSQ